MATVGTLTVKVDAREFERALRDATERFEAAVRQRDAQPPVVAGAVAAGLMLAGSSRRRVSRRSLLTFGLLK